MKMFSQIKKTARPTEEKRIFISWILSCLLFIIAMPIMADGNLTVDSNDKKEINRIKAAYLYNFLKYVDFKSERSQNNQNAFTVCIYGEDSFSGSLDSLAGRKAKGLDVKVKLVNKGIEILDCHIIYISESEIEELKTILNKLKNHSILTVSDIENFASKGGIIGFNTLKNKLAIEINLNNAIAAEIKISALLLEIAIIVE